MKKQTVSRLAVLVLLLVLSVGVCTAKAEESNEGGNQETGQETVQYTVTKVSEKIQMLPGETRMISTIIPSDATYESSNTAVVLVSNSGQLIAQKAGTVKITETSGTQKKIYTVKVNNTIDLIVFAGQSNMCGSGGNYNQAPTAAYGTAYEFDLDTNTKKCILLKEPFGEGQNRSTGLDDTNVYSSKGTLVSAFCINYYKQTKTPVVGIAASWGGTSTNTWLNRGLVKETQKKIRTAKKQLKKQGIKIRHIYMVWYQGESDAAQGKSEKEYISAMKKIQSAMKRVGVEKTFVIEIGHDTNHPDLNWTIMGAQKTLCKKYADFILVSKKAPTFYNNYTANYSDCIHLNQNSLNKIGYEAGTNAGKYAKKHSK